MTTITSSLARIGAALVAALAVLALAVPLAGASTASPPPHPHGLQMSWYRWHPSGRSLQAQTRRFGSSAVLGLESPGDVAALQAAYGLTSVRAIPALHAAEV